VVRRGEGRERPHESSQRPVQSVTNAPPSVADEQSQRVRRYLLTMTIRIVCGGLAILASGWLRWALVAAAVVLPYIAVVMANAVGPRVGDGLAPVDEQPDDIRAIPVVPADETDRTISGRLLDD
jgi:Protein of unknown function (DUF3099)